MYSAVKIKGVPLYVRARRGETVERKARTVEIKRLELLEEQLPHLALLVNCSKGTYIRTLCHDIGQKLGVGACLTFLLRTRAGAYTLAGAATLEEIAEKKEGCLLPLTDCIKDLPSISLDKERLVAVRSGRTVTLPLDDLEKFGYNPEKPNEAGLTAALDVRGVLQALGQIYLDGNEAKFKPKKVFNVE